MKVIDREKRSKTLSEVKPVKTISKTPQNVSEKSPKRRDFIPLHKLQDHVYEW